MSHHSFPLSPHTSGFFTMLHSDTPAKVWIHWGNRLAASSGLRTLTLPSRIVRSSYLESPKSVRWYGQPSEHCFTLVSFADSYRGFFCGQSTAHDTFVDSLHHMKFLGTVCSTWHFCGQSTSHDIFVDSLQHMTFLQTVKGNFCGQSTAHDIFVDSLQHMTFLWTVYKHMTFLQAVRMELFLVVWKNTLEFSNKYSIYSILYLQNTNWRCVLNIVILYITT